MMKAINSKKNKFEYICSKQVQKRNSHDRCNRFVETRGRLSSVEGLFTVKFSKDVLKWRNQYIVP